LSAREDHRFVCRQEQVQLGEVVLAYSPSTQEAETGELQAQGQPELPNNTCQKKK
jgi:hypothetical protein